MTSHFTRVRLRRLPGNYVHGEVGCFSAIVGFRHCTFGVLSWKRNPSLHGEDHLATFGPVGDVGRTFGRPGSV